MLFFHTPLLLSIVGMPRAHARAETSVRFYDTFSRIAMQTTVYSQEPALLAPSKKTFLGLEGRAGDGGVHRRLKEALLGARTNIVKLFENSLAPSSLCCPKKKEKKKNLAACFYVICSWTQYLLKKLPPPFHLTLAASLKRNIRTLSFSIKSEFSRKAEKVVLGL